MDENLLERNKNLVALRTSLFKCYLAKIKIIAENGKIINADNFSLYIVNLLNVRYFYTSLIINTIFLLIPLSESSPKYISKTDKQ